MKSIAAASIGMILCVVIGRFWPTPSLFLASLVFLYSLYLAIRFRERDAVLIPLWFFIFSAVSVCLPLVERYLGLVWVSFVDFVDQIFMIAGMWWITCNQNAFIKKVTLLPYRLLCILLDWTENHATRIPKNH
jgi:hypothetical protein